MGSQFSDLAGRSISENYFGSTSYPYTWTNSGTVNASKSPNVLYSATDSYTAFTPRENLTGVNSLDLAGDYHYNILSSLYNPAAPATSIYEPSWLIPFDLPAVVDKGSPSSNYTDLDLTRNDIGILGGSHSWLNYWYNDSTTTGKAVIRWVDLPSEIWPGQTINLKAEAVHTN